MEEEKYQYQKEYYQRNKERLKEYQREYYQRKKSKALEYEHHVQKVKKMITQKPNENENETKTSIVKNKVHQFQMLSDWNDELREKLETEKLNKFSKWAVEMNLRENEKTMNQLNDDSNKLFYLGNRNEVIDQLVMFVKSECENAWKTQLPQVVRLKRQFLKQLTEKLKSYRT